MTTDEIKEILAAIQPPAPRLTYDIKEAAEILGCTENFLREGVEHHGFPHTWLGQRRRFSMEQLREIQVMHEQRGRDRKTGNRAQHRAPRTVVQIGSSADGETPRLIGSRAERRIS